MKRLRNKDTGIIFGWNRNMARLPSMEEYEDGVELGAKGVARQRAAKQLENETQREEAAKKAVAAEEAKADRDAKAKEAADKLKATAD